jgi:hypothetical protein
MKRYPALSQVLGSNWKSDWKGNYNYMNHLERQLSQVHALIKAIYPEAVCGKESVSLGSIHFKPMEERFSHGLVGIQVQLPGSTTSKTLLRKIKLLQGKIDEAMLKAKVEELKSLGEMQALMDSPAEPPVPPPAGGTPR